MPSHITVDDLVLPTQIAGHPALELVNTRAGWGDTRQREHEYLASLDHVTVLARLNGLLDDERAGRLRGLAARKREESDRVVTRTRRLRGALHDVVVGTASPTTSRRVAAAVSEARARQVLAIDDDDVAGWRFPGSPQLTEPLDAFLVSAGDLLVERPRVGACPGHGCGWLFLDRTGRRRWCQMAVCGNRAKQAAHVARARS
jgi:hypothetical protein